MDAFLVKRLMALACAYSAGDAEACSPAAVCRASLTDEHSGIADNLPVIAGNVT
jgi:hypothetical protein